MSLAADRTLCGPAGLTGRVLRHAVLGRLRGLDRGRLVIQDADGRYAFGACGDGVYPAVTVRVHHPRVWRRVALRGSIGVGEAYMAGEWSCDDLTALVRLFLLNRSTLDGMESGIARLAAPAFRAWHLLHRNTRRGSRRNIAAHYDLGNDFYRLFLDRRLMYSAAVFAHPQADLDAATTLKLEMICRKLELGPQDRVLEIGTGWGGFALHAASRYGCHVTTTTLSREQYRFATERVREAGLEDRVTVIMQDYRDLAGAYDKLVSIEMIEAVGHAWLETYFSTCARLLRPHGQMLLQAITIADREYERARRSVDFIQRYIFPGGFLPSVGALAGAVARASDFRIFHLEDIGPHYATTLAHWRRRFLLSRDRVRTMGYPESFIRMWEYYLCYCEGGFAERALGTVQVLLTRPDCRRQSLLSAQCEIHP